MGTFDSGQKQPVPMQRLLAPRTEGLGGLLRKARALETLSAQLRLALPDTLRQGWAVGRVDPQEVVLIAESSAWATRLRYSRLVILQTTRDVTGFTPKELKVKIVPPPRKRPSKGPAQLPAEAARTLRQAAKGFGSSNRRLSQALERLASRGDNKDE